MDFARVTVIRHGETIWNREKILQGHKDIKLSHLGIKQAYAIAKRLDSQKINALYSSDLRRWDCRKRSIPKVDGNAINILESLEI